MAEDTIYTRTYSKRSAGRLVSAKGPKGDPLSDTALVEEFRNHADKWSQEPTAFVSGSDRIVDTVKRAFDKYYKDDEPPADIWIAFIKVPRIGDQSATRIHSAKELAEKCELEDPNKFAHEVVFEWAIPENDVSHEVSLQTLMNRGLSAHEFLQPSTAEVRRSFAEGFQESGLWGPCDIGLELGCFARDFGLSAPVEWIADQLFYDCVRKENLDNDKFKLRYAHGFTKIVDSKFFDHLNDGIRTSLYIWWLADIDFISALEEFEEWRAVMEDIIVDSIVGLWKISHDPDGTKRELSVEEETLYDEKEQKMDKLRMEIEEKAEKLGL